VVPDRSPDQPFGLAERQAENRSSVSAVVIANAE
jgi:hypothetical protein